MFTTLPNVLICRLGLPIECGIRYDGAMGIGYGIRYGGATGSHIYFWSGTSFSGGATSRCGITVNSDTFGSQGAGSL